MSPSDDPAAFLGAIDQFLSSDAIQKLVFVEAVLMLIGVAIVAVVAWRYLQINWWLKVLIELAICFVGTGLSLTAYETYHIVHIVDEKRDISQDSQKIEALFQTIDKTSRTVQETSQTVNSLSRTVQELSRKINDLSCPPEKTICRHKTCRSECSSKASIAVPPSKSASSPSQAALLALQANGWVYVGTGLGLEWDEKYFDWDADTERLPEKGDVLTATGAVHLRVPLGCQARIVGAIDPGEEVEVLRTQTVADCHHWVQVKRI